MKATLPDLKKLKRKTAMVVSEIEEALGNYQAGDNDLGEEFAADPLSGRGPANQNTMYLDDFFQRVLKMTANTNHGEQVLKLYKLAQTLDLWTIRAACSHPNNTFFPDYWYRVATIASNQIFSELGLDSVPESLALAESGSITDPPDDWADKILVTIPNNLPFKKDYDITNLIGREKELSALHKNLVAQRTSTLAIVAPGGIGKTALALGLLDRISRDNQAASWVDGIVYVTLKLDQLTIDGVSKLASRFNNKSSTGIGMVRELQCAVTDGLSDIFGEDINTFEVAISAHSTKKLILCIDNLETLIVEHPQAVDEFLELIPMSWKVIITSRISIDDAKHVPLAELKPRSAEQLARKYLEAKNGPLLDEVELADIAKRCLCNPLSIRLTLDLYILGDTLPIALNTAQDAIADFSFNNLVEKLSQNAVYILEYSSNGIVSRKTICEQLGISNEEAAEAISELNRTSLVKRVSAKDDDFEEKWEVSGAISGLVRGNERMYKARAYIENKKNTMKDRARSDERAQEKHNSRPWGEDYVDLKHEATFKVFLFGVNRDLRPVNKMQSADQPSALNTILQGVENNQNIYSDKADYWVLRGMLNRRLMQNVEMQQCYDVALDIAPDDIYIQFKYARSLKIARVRDSALELYEPLVRLHENSGTDTFEMEFINNLYEDYYSVLLVSENWSRMIIETTKWQDGLELRAIQGSYRALAYQRLSERATRADKEKFLNSAISILDDILSSEGYFRTTCHSALRIVDEIIHVFFMAPYADEFAQEAPALVDKGLAFCDKHLQEIIDTLPNEPSLGSKIKALSTIAVVSNPFQSFKWLRLANPIMENGVSPDEVPESAILVTVKRLPTSKKTDGSNAAYLFARAEDGTEYFLSRDLIYWKDWNKIAEGDKLAIVEYDRNPKKDDVFTVKKAITINW